MHSPPSGRRIQKVVARCGLPKNLFWRQLLHPTLSMRSTDGSYSQQVAVQELFPHPFCGDSILVIGGDKRPESVQRLKKRLGLDKVEWIATRQSDPTPQRFCHIIADPSVGLVVALIGLIRHQHARDISRLCRKYEKPLLRLHRSLSVAALIHAAGFNFNSHE